MNGSKREKKNAETLMLSALDMQDEACQDRTLETALIHFGRILIDAPEDVDVLFHISFLNALLNHREPLSKKREALGVFLSDFDRLARLLPGDSSLDGDAKKRLLADMTVKANLLIEDFIREEIKRSNLVFLVGAIARNRAIEGDAPDLDKLALYRSSLDELSNTMTDWGLTGTARLIASVQRAGTDNASVCCRALIENGLKAALNAPALVYGDAFYKSFLPSVRRAIDAARTLDPHTPYYLPEPDYGPIAPEIKTFLSERYRLSALRECIETCNRAEREKAIGRYWQNHAGERDALEQNLRALEMRRDADRTRLEQNRAILRDAEQERDEGLRPLIEARARAAQRIDSLNGMQKALRFFQLRKRRAVRERIAAETAILWETENAYRKKRADAERVFERKTGEVSAANETLLTSLRRTEREIAAIRERLSDPLNDAILRTE